jgi:uncharacterized protein with LGFP repeats
MSRLKKEDPMLKIKCKECASMIEVPIPEPKEVEKIVKEPCKCGLTENARTSRHWAVAVAIAVVVITFGISGSCVADKHYETGKITAETEKLRAQTAGNEKEMREMSAELQKYKTFFEEWKKLPGGPPEVPRPPIDSRATPHPAVEKK